MEMDVETVNVTGKKKQQQQTNKQIDDNFP